MNIFLGTEDARAYYALLAEETPNFRVDDPVARVVNECMKAARRAFMRWEALRGAGAEGEADSDRPTRAHGTVPPTSPPPAVSQP